MIQFIKNRLPEHSTIVATLGAIAAAITAAAALPGKWAAVMFGVSFVQGMLVVLTPNGSVKG